jgi:hypothetical protein
LFRVVIHEVIAAFFLLVHEDDLRCVDDVLVYHLLLAVAFPLARLLLLDSLDQLVVQLLFDLQVFLEISLLLILGQLVFL